MDKITLMLSNLKYDLLRLIEPYKHTSISTIDSDIENQIEKVSKKAVVASGNIIVNTLIFIIDGAKFLHYFLIDEFDKYMNIQNSESIQYVNITHPPDDKSDAFSETNEDSDKNEQANEDYDEITNNEEEEIKDIKEIEEKKHEPSTSWFGFGGSKDKLKDE
jgi:hypothetical protein|tara:strand:- start:1538 stop:2023 length:486 start_codon:yes stop_codon:yes gene_type:complete